MTQIRKHAEEGDVIIGMAGSDKKQGLGRIHPQLIFWMLVDQAMSFDDYWSDSRFVDKRPQIPGPKMRMVGDRTYRHEPGHIDWQFDVSMHYVPGAKQRSGGHVAKDTSVNRILVGKRFTYWGDSGPKVPPHLISLFPIRNQKCPPDGPLLAELHQLIDVANPRGVRGDPADWDNPRYFKP